MTLDELKAKIRLIRKRSCDDACAHGMEDNLREEVLKEIANGAKNGQELAIEVLKTSDIDFCRWCA